MAVTALSFLLFAFAYSGEQNSAIGGRVVNSATGQAIHRARVALRNVDGLSAASAVTDDNGRFLFSNVPPGSYRLHAGRTGFAASDYGARIPNRPGAVFTIAPGQENRGLEMGLTPHGAIGGRVIDAEGEPAPYAEVYCFEYGKPAAHPIAAATTNDLGEYRIAELLPGAYVIAAVYRPKDPKSRDFVPTYYPGATDHAAASPIEVGPGMDVRGIAFAAQRKPIVTVRGRVRLPGGPDGRVASLMLMPRENGAFLDVRAAAARGDGSFEIAGVAPGSYLLAAFHGSGGSRLSGQVPVEVGSAPVEGVEVALAPGIPLAGRVRFEGSLMDGARVLLEPAGIPLNFAHAAVKTGGAFAFESVAPDTYAVKLSGAPEEFYVKTVRFGDEVFPSTRLPVAPAGPHSLDILLAKGSELTGVVLDEQDKAAAATVVLMPGCHSVDTDAFGRFMMRGIPPGEYRVSAGDFADCEAAGAAGQAITIQENGSHAAEVRLGKRKGSPR